MIKCNIRSSNHTYKLLYGGGLAIRVRLMVDGSKDRLRCASFVDDAG